MGIKHFFYWFKQNHGDCIETTHVFKPLPQQNIEIDVLALDLNGLFHTATQRVFQYGTKQNTQTPRFFDTKKQQNIQELRMKCYKETCEMIDSLVYMVQPKKRLLLCVDGVAGLSKCQQQRQRRFRSAKERTSAGSDIIFDSCSITPGTKFMHYLNKYIEWHILHKINNGDWSHLDVIFSSEKVPGEGEHKCKNLFKTHCDPSEHMMIYGLDADLIMLCLSTNLPHIYVYRDNTYNSKERFVIDISKFADKLKDILNTKSAVADFIFMCFMVGNDFLPSIPGLEIISNGIEHMLTTYKQVCLGYEDGLIQLSDYRIRVPTLLQFFRSLADHEIPCLKEKFKNRRKYFEDELMNRHFQMVSPNLVECDFETFRKDYYHVKMDMNLSQVTDTCHQYIMGLQWVIIYYCREIPSWLWFYPFHYAPFLNDLANCKDYEFTPFPKTSPLNIFEQLLSVLPPQSADLLPNSLQPLMTSPESVLQRYYPSEFKIDLSGKRSEWEGIVVLPIMDTQLMRQTYEQKKGLLTPFDLKLNEPAKPIRFVLTRTPYRLKNTFGDIPSCKVKRLKL